LDLHIIPPTGIEPQHVQKTDITPFVKHTKHHYKTVDIQPLGKVVPVKEVQ